MARTVECIPSVTNGKRMYPWEDWLDGQTWELIQGEDFQSSPQVFAGTARQQINRTGAPLRVSQVGDKVYIGPRRSVNGS